MNKDIDIVIPWVDGTDKRWQQEKRCWYHRLNPDQESNSDTRYQSWDSLHYWFRAVETYLPWFHKIFFITYGHIPEFLDLNHPRLKVVMHEDFIPREFLPTFQVNAIEMNLHRIPELSENIIYFNDDTFPLRPIDETYYYRDNQVCDEAVETPVIPVLSGEIARYTWNMRMLDTAVINRHFNKREVQGADYGKWFCEDYGELLERNSSLSYWDHFVGFRDPHVPTAIKKSTFEKLWEAEPELLKRTCETKFRNDSCVNQWLARYWQLCTGDFYPRKTQGRSYTVNARNCEEIAGVILRQEQQMICLNEACTGEEFELVKHRINAAFQAVLPSKSSFEKQEQREQEETV